MLRSLILAAGFAILLAGPLQAKTLKLATLAPKGSPWHEVLLDMVAEWEAAGEGEIKVRIYPGGVLGDDPTLMQKMNIKQLDGGIITAAGLTQLVPDMWIFGMPRLVRSYEELDYLRAEIGPELRKQFLDKGFVVLNWGEVGWVRFFSRTPVVTPDDLRRIKLFVWAGNPVLEDAWRKENFDIVPLPATELFAALQSGMVDAYSTTSAASLSFQWFGMAPHMLDLNWAPLVGATIIRRDSWEAIPEAVREKMLAAAEKAGRRFRERTRSFESEAVRVMVDNGLTVTEPSPEVVAQWEGGAAEAGEIIRARYVNAALAERAKRLLRDYRAGVSQSGASN